MELFRPLVATDIVYEDTFPSIQRYANDARYSPAARAKLDLLVYVTHHHAVVDRSTQPPELSSLGWRSISCLFGKHAYVWLRLMVLQPFFELNLAPNKLLDAIRSAETCFRKIIGAAS